MKPPRNTSPGARRIDGLDAERRLLVDAVAVENHRTVLAERDAQHLIVPLAKDPQRLLDVVRAGEVRRHVLREDGVRDRAHQFLGPIRQAVDVTGHDRAAGASDFRRPNRRVVVHIVHVDDAGSGQRFGRQFAFAQGAGGRRDPTARSARPSWRRRESPQTGFRRHG
jgi:hypothetical protein